MSKQVDLSGIDWDDQYPRLVHFAHEKLQRLRWRGKRGGAIPGGMRPEDFVHEAIKKTLSEERTLNLDITPFAYFAGLISSLINHLVESPDNTKTLEVDDDKIIPFPDPQEDPEQALIRKSQEQEFLAYLGKKKPVLRRLAELMLYDPAWKLCLTDKLNLSSTEVDSLKRALRRTTKDFLEGEHVLSKAEALFKTAKAPISEGVLAKGPGDKGENYGC
jgi:hypothetical protein